MVDSNYMKVHSSILFQKSIDREDASGYRNGIEGESKNLKMKISKIQVDRLSSILMFS